MRTNKNVLVIMTDQQRKDCLGCYGNPIVQTPNIDRLAEEGVRFERCYVANPICMPNRLSIFTGTYPRNHGLWTNGLCLEHERRTLGYELGKQGYQTASFGKIHFTTYGGKRDNWESMKLWESLGDDFEWKGPYWGFEHVEMTLSHKSELISHYGKWFRQKGGSAGMFEVIKEQGDQTGVRNLPPELHESTFIGERTAEFIMNERDKERPFFIVASFPDPHHPFNPPKESAQKYSSDQVVKPVGGPEDLKTRPAHYEQHFRGGWHRKGAIPEAHPEGLSEELQNSRIAYTYAMIDLIDKNVGTIIDALKKAGVYEDTLILFTSDHGELLGDHGLWLKGPFFYEGLVNVSLIVSMPGKIEAGVSCELASSIDIFPTVMDVLGLEIPEYVNGVSQKNNLLDTSIPARDKCLVEYRNGYGKNDCSTKVLVTKRYKYVRYQNGEDELTDLVKDPQEKLNVVRDPEYADTVRSMKDTLLDEILSSESRYPEQISLA